MGLKNEPLALPPYADFLGVTVDRDGEGELLFTLCFSPVVSGRPGFLHGGAIAGLLEIAAVGTVLDALAGETGTTIKPITVTVDYMRGGRERETYAAGRITRLGTRIANVEAFAWQEDRDKVIASARMNLMVRRGG